MKTLGLLCLALVLVGCSSKEAENTETTQTGAQSTYGRTVEKAKEAAVTLSNPKPGLDPVCGMPIDENAPAVVVAIAEKNYGVCSEDCATKLRAEPDKYVQVAAGY